MEQVLNYEINEKVEILPEIRKEEQIKKNEQIEELRLGEFKEIINPIQSAFEEESKKDDFFQNENLNALVQINENRNNLIEVNLFKLKIQNLRKTWIKHNNRIQDFKKKRLLKYPQIFIYKSSFYLDFESNSLIQKTMTLSKYTVNIIK